MKGLTKKVLKRLLPSSEKESIKVRIPFSAKVTSESHNSVVLMHNGLAVPPIIMRDKVRRSAVLAEDFILEGQQAFLAIKDMLEQNGVKLGNDTKFLEFGVGCGRIARHFFGTDVGSFCGTDVDNQMISWCSNVLSKSDSRFVFFKNDYLPPLAIEEQSLDVVFSISVFTHMQMETQDAWFCEMARIIKHGGYLLISIIEKSKEKLPQGIMVRERLDEEYKRDWFGVGGAPKTYFSTANTENYITVKLASDFEFIAKQSKAIRELQSLLLYKRC